MRLEIIQKEMCTACGACENICKQNAIVMQADEEGFLYPAIDDEKCTDCGLCVRVCPLLQQELPMRTSVKNATVYAAWSKSEDTRLNSTSGGVFSELARGVLAQGGYVVGARYDADFSIKHDIISTEDGIPLLRQSKYAQSTIGSVPTEIKTLLSQGKQVLFCGTPCQVAGLRSFLGKDYDNLVLCDFICRGVNSPKIFRLYLDMLAKKYGAPVQKVQFKNKDYGWNDFHTKIEFANQKSYYGDRQNDLFMRGYLRHNLYVRPACHQCYFKEGKRYADLTLGDFWGIGKTRPHLDENKGTSVVLVNTPKGEAFFRQNTDNLVVEKCSTEEAVDGNTCLVASLALPPNRDAFFKDLARLPFPKLLTKYYELTFRKRLKAWIKYKLFLWKHKKRSQNKK